MIQPGRRNTRVAFQRRALVGGIHQGALEPAFHCWAAWLPEGASERAEAGTISDAVAGTLVIPDTPRARALARLDRVTIRGSDLMIASAAIPEGNGELRIKVARMAGGT